MYKEELQTNNVTNWINTREYIVLHHTWTWEWTIKGVLNTLTKWKVSCHYVISENGDLYKIWNTNQILWHAGISEWNWKKDMNNYSIWIEVIWPMKDWFTKEQRVSLRKLVEHLMFKFNISNDKVIRHKDIAAGRKIDIDNRIFTLGWFKTFKDYQNSLIAKEYK